MVTDFKFTYDENNYNFVFWTTVQTFIIPFEALLEKAVRLIFIPAVKFF